MILIENQHERSHNIKQKQKTKTSRLTNATHKDLKKYTHEKIHTL